MREAVLGFAIVSNCRRIALLALFAVVFAAPRAAQALPPTLDGRLSCVVASKVMVCTVALQPSATSHITWAEASVVLAPPFVQAVRSKATYTGGAPKNPQMYLVFTPNGTGDGSLIVHVNAIVCADNGTACPAASKVLQLPVHYGG
ncbi:MAG TPA: hypothetical protein VJT73_18240 [Polyangiaceae bacterium]|nr:hypothetical protein [Polyangiaceae bacterium]